MHLLMFVMVKTVELATDIASRASISADGYFEHSFLHPLCPFQSSFGREEAVFPALVTPSFLHFLHLCFHFTPLKCRGGMVVCCAFVNYILVFDKFA